MEYLTYGLADGRYVNRWLKSDAFFATIESDPVQIEEDVDVWEGSPASASQENPIRKAFVLRRKKEKDRLPFFQIAIKNYIGFNGVDWSSILAASIISMIPVIVIFIILQRYIIGGISASGVKG